MDYLGEQTYFISKEQLLELAEPLKKNQYGQYLIRRANEELV